MQEGTDSSVLPTEENAVILARLYIFLEADGGSTVPGIVDQKRVKEQQHITAKQQHPLADAARHGRHGDHKLVKQGGRTPVRQKMRDRGKQLSDGGILRDALAVAPAVDHQNPLPGKGRLTLADCLQYREGSSTAPDTYAALIRENQKAGPCWQKSPACIQLCLKPLSLMGVAGCEHHIVPHREGSVTDASLIVAPGILIGLCKIKACIHRFSLPF